MLEERGKENDEEFTGHQTVCHKDWGESLTYEHGGKHLLVIRHYGC